MHLQVQLWTCTVHVAGGYVQWGVSDNCSQLVWCAGDCILERFMMCAAAQYYEFGLMKEDEMEMGIWKVRGEERGKRDFGGDRGGKEANCKI